MSTQDSDTPTLWRRRLRFDRFELDEADARLTSASMGNTSTRETDCALPKPVFATMEEVCYADESRLQLRARLLRDGAAVAEPCSVGIH